MGCWARARCTWPAAGPPARPWPAANAGTPRRTPHAELAAAAAAPAQRIIDLDARYGRENRAVESSFAKSYRRLVTDCTALLRDLGRDGVGVPAQTHRLEELLKRSGKLAAAPNRRATGRKS